MTNPTEPGPQQQHCSHEGKQSFTRCRVVGAQGLQAQRRPTQEHSLTFLADHPAAAAS